MFSIKLGHVVCDGRVMAITVNGLEPVTDRETPTDEGAVEFARNVSEDPTVVLHITVGTREEEINPFEARALVESWKKGKTENVTSISLDDSVAEGRVKGLF